MDEYAFYLCADILELCLRYLNKAVESKVCVFNAIMPALPEFCFQNTRQIRW